MASVYVEWLFTVVDFQIILAYPMPIEMVCDLH